MKRAVLVICDGLRADMVRPHWTPNICRLMAEGRAFRRHRGVFPSTTRTTSASIATGCQPGRHGLEGNVVALDEGDGLVALSVGPADFRDRLRRATGRTLHVPTLAERLARHGGQIVFSNVSPGAAYFQDPDGHGHVYHRAGSWGPGLSPITGADHLQVSHDGAGDAEMCERFCAEVLRRRRPASAVLWQCEPDLSQHRNAIGSEAHLAALAAADNQVARVAETVAALNGAGEDVLLVVASDHGHETVDGFVDLVEPLMAAGLKASAASSDVVVAANGLSALIYLSDDARGRLQDVAATLAGVPGVNRVYAGAELAQLGHRSDGALVLAVTTRWRDAVNEHGIPGCSLAITNPLGDDSELGCGQHGGLGTYEQQPFLFALGGGFARASESQEPTSALDIAPMILRHLELPGDGMDGHAPVFG